MHALYLGVLVVVGGLLGFPTVAGTQPAAGSAPQKKFDPPRITYILRALDTGDLPEGQADQRTYYINKGVESSINQGNELNVYREKRLSSQIPRPLRIFIGTMKITSSQPGSSVGTFSPNAAALAQPLIRYKTPMKNDIVVPTLIIDSEVLFDAGSTTLKRGAGEEFKKVTNFVKNFSPSKLIIEGHTDADGDLDYNLKLSEERAKEVKNFLLLDPENAAFLTKEMIDAKGYGEERPIAPNDTPENKAFNRRIEVIVWE